MAERAGIKATQVSRYETNQVQPQLQRLQRLQRLLDALDVTLTGFVLTLHYVAQLRAILEQETPPATLLRHTADRWWGEVMQEHLEMAVQVGKAVGARFRLMDAD